MYHKWATVIMRAQPFHNHHKALVDKAMQLAPNVLLILGSFSPERTARNPFLAHERKEMIHGCYPMTRRLRICYAFDQPGNDALWREGIEERVRLVTGQERALVVANCKPGETYLRDIFHDWPQHCLYDNHPVSATEIRDAYFRGDDISQHVPAAVLHYLMCFALTEEGDEAFDAYWNGVEKWRGLNLTGSAG